MTEKFTVPQFCFEMMDHYKYYSVPPRMGKSFMSEAKTRMWNTFKAAYDKAYLSLFNQIKEDVGEEFSDDEIRDFINKNIVFEVELEDKGFHENPQVFITYKFKELELDVKP